MLKSSLPFIIAFSICSILNAQVAVYTGKEEIPSYKLGMPEPSPIFYTGRGVQGAAGHIYPYPAQTNLGEQLTTETYDMIYLENEYLKVTILPAFGGRLFSAIDKTNGHEIFHRNSVIKPDLIGTLGAWISGGIEWCFPHHHRTSTLMPADYRIVENEDGSATVWVGENEKTLQLRGVIGITLRPGRSYIEVDYRLNNPCPTTRNFLFWANVAITADEDWRTFWPPSQEIGVFHSNTSFTHWPISHENYRGIDYTSGVDLTWWKNHPDPVSFFFWQGKEGFIGGYNYKAKAGTLHVGDVYENRTSKLWQFGPGLNGQNARRKLTDDGRAYVELMTGSFSNNQPDYGWFFPHSVKDAKNYWSPIRDLEIVKNANKDAAVTLQMRDSSTVFYGFNTTQLFAGAQSVLRYKGIIIERNIIDIDPGNPFTSTFSGKDVLDEYQFSAELLDRDGKLLISYQPYKPLNPDLPEVQEKPGSPKEIQTVEDLYLTGRFVEQFSRPGVDADDYYLEALRRSPNDYRVNLALGIRRVNQWRYEEALHYLQTAADKLRVKYIQPKEGELFYYLALAQKGLGLEEEASNYFHQATWYYPWYSASYYQIALMECVAGNESKALEYVMNAYSTNNLDGSISVLYSALLRKQGKYDQALVILNKLLDYDPINFSAIYERSLISGEAFEKWTSNMQDIENNYLQIASLYVNAGWYKDGIDLLESIKETRNPLVYYYLSFLYRSTNESKKSMSMIRMADKLSLDYCFPYREETLRILEFVVKTDPENIKASYLLGNILYEKRPDEAIDAWIRTVEADNEFSMGWRNLAFGEFYHKRNTDKAIEYIHKAIELNSERSLWYEEMAVYYDHSDENFRNCLSVMEENMNVVRKDINAPKSLVKLYNLAGEYDKAIELLSEHHFRTWEGGREIYFHYVDAHTLKAIQLMESERYEEAVNELQNAMEYPENLEVGKPLNDERNAMIYYFMGKAWDSMKSADKARSCYQKSVEAVNSSQYADLIYYQALASLQLGEKEKANKLFEQLLETGTKLLEEGAGSSGIAIDERITDKKSISEAYYLQALGNKGLGKVDQSRSLFDKSLEINKNNLWATVLKNLKLY